MYKPHKRPTGESCYNAVLTEEKVKAIRENRLGMTDKDQANLYGVSANTIFRVRKFEAWCHV